MICCTIKHLKLKFHTPIFVLLINVQQIQQWLIFLRHYRRHSRVKLAPLEGPMETSDQDRNCWSLSVCRNLQSRVKLAPLESPMETSDQDRTWWSLSVHWNLQSRVKLAPLECPMETSDQDRTRWNQSRVKVAPLECPLETSDQDRKCRNRLVQKLYLRTQVCKSTAASYFGFICYLYLVYQFAFFHIKFLVNGPGYGKSCYKLLRGNHTLAFDWYYFWWLSRPFEVHFSLGCHFHIQYVICYTRYVHRISPVFGRLSRHTVSKQQLSFLFILFVGPIVRLLKSTTVTCYVFPEVISQRYIVNIIQVFLNHDFGDVSELGSDY